MWASLQNHWRSSGFVGRSLLLKEFHNAVLPELEEARYYTHQICSLRKDLAELDCSLPEEMIADKLLKGLGPQFERFQAETLQPLAKGEIHILQVRDLIEQEYIRRRKEQHSRQYDILEYIWQPSLSLYEANALMAKERSRRRQKPLDCNVCKKRDRVTKDRAKRARTVK